MGSCVNHFYKGIFEISPKIKIKKYRTIPAKSLPTETHSPNKPQPTAKKQPSTSMATHTHLTKNHPTSTLVTDNAKPGIGPWNLLLAKVMFFKLEIEHKEQPQ